ncbi:hypothetical protein AURDEDRAFT_86599 [Auricularia subglabra TFB-10046 SS5]|nr:hypothetical protein AURDEDRAFT_86599 [Auricularia subglabra TFB-10046 SS5]
MCIRILGHMMVALGDFRRILGTVPIHRLTAEIISTWANGTLVANATLVSITDVLRADCIPNIRALGQLYLERLLRAFKLSKGPILREDDNETPSSFDSLTALTDAYLSGSGSRPYALKRQALVRDGFRCVITGRYDRESAVASATLDQRAIQERATQGPTNCCQILSEATIQNLNDADPAASRRRHNAASVMGTLASFGLEDLAANLSDENGIHSLKNVMTMSLDSHNAYDDLYVWLEPTSVPHQYKLRGRRWQDVATLSHEIGDIIKFEVHGPDPTLALPDPRFICLHAICARVAHMSGAAEYFEKVEREDDEQAVLAPDGSSAHILEERITRVLVMAS